MKKLSLLTITILLSATSAFAQEVPRYPYMQMVKDGHPLAVKMTKTHWTQQDEADFGAFVEKIGINVETKKCRTFDQCMKNQDVNPFAKFDPPGEIRYFADCADVPYWLRIYFAFHRGLPFTMTSNTSPRDPNDPRRDSRNHAIAGNLVAQRADSVSVNGRFPVITQFLGSPTRHGLIMDSVSSGTLRMPVIPSPNEPLQDFYPVAISKQNGVNSIKRGTVIYTADGHVAIVYKVDADGNIRTLNGHPADAKASQSPLSVRDYNDTFKRSRQEHGSIFKNFRPVELVGAQFNGKYFVGGRIELTPDNMIRDASYEQATKKHASSNEYLMFVRKSMASGDLRMNVVTEFNRSLKNLCDTIQGRVELVDQAIRSGMDQKNLPVGPENIFSAHGDWENYSTPSRDVNIRVLFKKTLEDLKASVNGFKSGDPTYVYSKAPSQLPYDLFEAYKAKVLSCKVSFTSRQGAKRELNLEEVRVRMFKISFDPYQCADLRWGDTASGEKSCPEDMRWYNAQGYLRNLTEKNSDNHAMTVEQMEAQNRAKYKDMDSTIPNIIGYIKSLVQPAAPVPVTQRR